MKVTIVSRETRRGVEPVYQIRRHDNGTVEMLWYGADGVLSPFQDFVTAAKADEYLARARQAPDSRIETVNS